MPMLESVLRCAGLSLGDVDCFAVSAGPGSFTGLRIGVGAVKGLAFGAGRPCVNRPPPSMVISRWEEPGPSGC